VDATEAVPYVTVLDDAVPHDRLDVLVARLLRDVVDPGGRVIVSSYTDAGQPPRQLFDDLRAAGHPPAGIVHIDRPGRCPLLTAWLDA
jgi:hypothetical protein